jgi:hypothetical protein
MPFILESSFQKSGSRCSEKILCKFQVREVRFQNFFRMTQSCVWTPISVQKFRTVQGCIRPDVAVTCPDAHQCSTRNRISFSDIDTGIQLHPSRRQGNTIRTLSLIRQDVDKNCNRSDVNVTPSRRQSLLWKLCAVEVQPSRC